jgi:4-hydroxy-tetrahydrodipicolinate synthase
VAYNVPSRVGTNLLAATLASLWPLPNVVAVKESSGDLQQIARIAAELPPGKVLLAGDDPLLLPTFAVGGTGIVSVAGNVVPRAMARFVAAARSSHLATARAMNALLLPLFEALAAEPNPIPIKCALALAGIADSTPRLPLLAASATTRDRLRAPLTAVETAESAHA